MLWLIEKYLNIGSGLNCASCKKPIHEAVMGYKSDTHEFFHKYCPGGHNNQFMDIVEASRILSGQKS